MAAETWKSAAAVDGLQVAEAGLQQLLQRLPPIRSVRVYRKVDGPSARLTIPARSEPRERGHLVVVFVDHELDRVHLRKEREVPGGVLRQEVGERFSEVRFVEGEEVAVDLDNRNGWREGRRVRRT